MKKSIKLMLLALGLSLSLVACGGQEKPVEGEKTETTEAAAEEAVNNEMAFISTDDTKAILDEGKADDYILLDVRKVADYEAGHVDGFESADLDGATKGGDHQSGVDALKAALEGKDTENKQILIMCYSGAGYAQVGTDILINDLGVKPENVLTIDGGMKAW